MTEPSLLTEDDLDERLSRPSPQLVADIRRLESPLVVLGAAGKMGPSLCELARRAAEAAGHPLEIVAVSRFSKPASREWFEERHIRTLPADLLDRRAWDALPDTPNVAYLVGQKFGTDSNPSLTWAVNTLCPAACMDRYRQASIVALSTGNVYPLVPATRGGSREDDPLTPLGEYANAAVARERIFEFLSRTNGTRVAQLRLSYAIDLRYGVLHDLAHRIARGEPIPLETGHFVCIWQGDANESILRSFVLAESPPAPFNLSGPRIESIRETALQLGERLGVAPIFSGSESGSGFLSDCRRLIDRLGPPQVAFDTLLDWTAAWVKSGGRSLNLPTHFETRDGKY
jgi:nucleoside-diphosphate-sugar epimerase